MGQRRWGATGLKLHFPECSYKFLGVRPYAKGVTAGSPGLAMRSEASYPGSRLFKKVRYPEGVIADRKRVCNNAFSVEQAGGLNPG